MQPIAAVRRHDKPAPTGTEWELACLQMGREAPPKSQYQRGSPAGRFLKRFMLHMYWLGYSRT